MIRLILIFVSLPIAATAQPTLPWATLPDALAEAADMERPVLVFVHAPWCGPCLRMERTVFSDPEVRALLDRFVLAGLDFDDHETALVIGGQTRSPFGWARHLGAEATPSFVFLDPEGQPITRVTSYLDAEPFRLLLAYVATGAYRHASFEEYAHLAGGPPR